MSFLETGGSWDGTSPSFYELSLDNHEYLKSTLQPELFPIKNFTKQKPTSRFPPKYRLEEPGAYLQRGQAQVRPTSILHHFLLERSIFKPSFGNSFKLDAQL